MSCDSDIETRFSSDDIDFHFQTTEIAKDVLKTLLDAGCREAPGTDAAAAQARRRALCKQVLAATQNYLYNIRRNAPGAEANDDSPSGQPRTNPCLDFGCSVEKARVHPAISRALDAALRRRGLISGPGRLVPPIDLQMNLDTIVESPRSTARLSRLRSSMSQVFGGQSQESEGVDTCRHGLATLLSKMREFKASALKWIAENVCPDIDEASKAGCAGPVFMPADAPKVGNPYTLEDVQAHASEDDCWVAINGKVCDLTGFMAMHPGGVGTVLAMAGRDASREWNLTHTKDAIEKICPHTVIGYLVPSRPCTPRPPSPSGAEVSPAALGA